MLARKLCLSVLALSLAGSTPAGHLPREVVRFPSAGRPLAARVEWALEEAAGRGYRTGFWEGYSIRRLMGERSSIGTLNCDAADEPTLEEVVSGQKKEFPTLSARETARREARRVLDGMDGKGKPEKKVWKDVAVLIRHSGTARGPVSRIEMSSLDLPFDFEGLPLVWLGSAEDAESLAWLKTAFAGSATDVAKKQVLAAVGIHQSPGLVIPFLQAALAGGESDSLRKDAAFWIGQQDDPRACAVLLETARQDRSLEVRKSAVFAVSQVDLEASSDALIELARTADNREVRKEAVFWLSEKASKKALSAIEDLVYHDPETGVQEQALFVLSELHNGEGVSALIKVAKSHPNPHVRKKAIFWLGECGDRRAVEALVEIVKTN
jgi:hypothetical protein